MTLTADIAEALKCAGSDPQVLAEIAVKVMQERQVNRDELIDALMDAVGVILYQTQDDRPTDQARTGLCTARDAILSACPELGEHEKAFQYAKNLAEILHSKHFPDNTEWSCLDTTLGILTQIDNMTTKWDERQAEGFAEWAKTYTQTGGPYVYSQADMEAAFAVRHPTAYCESFAEWWKDFHPTPSQQTDPKRMAKVIFTAGHPAQVKVKGLEWLHADLISWGEFALTEFGRYTKTWEFGHGPNGEDVYYTMKFDGVVISASWSEIEVEAAAQAHHKALALSQIDGVEG